MLKPALKIGSVGVSINLIGTIVDIPEDAVLSVRVKRPDNEYFDLPATRVGAQSARVVTTAEMFAPDKFNACGTYRVELAVNELRSRTAVLQVQEL